MPSEGLKKLFDELREVVFEAEDALRGGRAGEPPGEAAPVGTEAAARPEAVPALESAVARGAGRAGDYLRDHPLAALGVAAVVGFVAGLAVSRRRDDE